MLSAAAASFRRAWLWRQAVSNPARALLLAVVVVSFLAGLAPRSSLRPTLQFADSRSPGDGALYADVISAVAAGAPYYSSVVHLQRERDYPVRPFVTIRPPTLALVSAAIGPSGILAAALALIAANAVAWYARLRIQRPVLRFCALAAMSAFGAAGFSRDILAMHEWWSGLLLSLALGIGPERRFGPSLACAVAAALVRELAVGFLLVLLAVQLFRKAWRRAAILGVTLVTLTLLLLFHMAAVNALVTPHDMASPGWFQLRGPIGFAHDFAVLLGLDHWPPTLVFGLAFSPLVGWLVAHRAVGLMPLAWFSSFTLVEGFLARADNWYWVQLILPAYLLGLLFVPGALVARLGPKVDDAHRRPAGG